MVTSKKAERIPAPQTATRCEACGRRLVYKPGQASAVLTAHYNAEHPRGLPGRPPAGRGWEPRPVRILRALAEATGGLSIGTIADVLTENTMSRRAAVRRYREILRQFAAEGKVAPARTNRRAAGAPEDLWRITAAGRRHLAAVDAAAAGKDAPQPALDRFGPGTPVVIRRRAAAIFRSQGLSARQIARAFGVTAATIGVDLRQAGPAPAAPDAAGELDKLAARAEEARQTRQALRETRGQFGAGTPIAIRRETAAILHDSLGLSYRDIGAIFGVSAAPIQQDVKRFPPPAAGYNAAARIRELGLRAQGTARPR